MNRRVPRKLIAGGAALLVALLASVLFVGSQATPTLATHTGGMDAMSIDMNPASSPGNTATALGSRTSQARINENDILDADEDLVDSLMIDVTATNIPASDGMWVFVYKLSYPSPPAPGLCVVAEDHDFLLTSIEPSLIINSSSSTPRCDVEWTGDVTNIFAFEDGIAGTGVLQRLTLETQAGVASGIYDLALDPTQSFHVNQSGTPLLPDTVNNASICINVACPDPDDDGVIGTDDLCPELAGPASNEGCPLAGPPAVGGIIGLLDPSTDTPSSNATGAGNSARLALIAAVPVALLATLLGGGFVLAGRRIL